MLRAVVLALAMSLTCMSLTWGAAQIDLTSPERQALERDIDQFQALLDERAQELAGIEAELGRTADALRQRIAERDRVSAELADRRRERERIAAQIVELEAQQAATEARIADLQWQLGELETRVRRLLVNLYKQRGRRLGASIASSDSFFELRVRNHYLGLLATQDANLIRELDGLLAELAAERARLAEQATALQAAEADLAQAERDLAAARDRLNAIVTELDATREGQLAQRQAVLEEQTRIEASLGDLSNQLEAEITRLREEEAAARAAAERYAQDRERRLEAERQADLARSRLDAITAPLAPLSSGFIRPLEDARLESRFGEGNNSYVAIRAPVPNAAVRAVQTGRVYAITYLGANFGYMVALQHDGDLLSIYVNLRQPLVELFDTVDQGAVLGYLGGGTLAPNDILQFYARRETDAGSPFIDPAPLLGW